jgi:outer membrane translocation and assembly module TamA
MAPGIDRQQGFLYQSLFIDADSRDDPEDATLGGEFQADWTRYAGRGSSRTNFSQLRLGGTRFFAISDTRIVSFGGEAVVSQVAEGHEVPFYLQPTLASFGPLRGFGRYRFRDRDVLLVNLEYRWRAFRNLQMSAFADAGTVGPRMSALGLSSWKDGYGLGVRFRPYKDLICHFDVRVSSEGVRYFLDFKVRPTAKP